MTRPTPRRTTREQAAVLLFLIVGGALVVALGLVFPWGQGIIPPGAMMLGTGLAVSALWFGAWRWR